MSTKMKVADVFGFWVLTASLLTVSAFSNVDGEELGQYTFDNFVVKFNKVYRDAEEYRKRSEIFYNNVDRMASFNRAPNKTYSLGVNAFSDLTDKEFRAQLHDKIVTAGLQEFTEELVRSKEDKDIPEAMSWQDTEPPTLSPIKTEGECKSSWAYAATEEVESMYAIGKGKLFSLSTQQVISCLDNHRPCDTASGCGDGTVQLAWEYIQNTGGIVSEEAYPDQNRTTNQTAKCILNRTIPKVVTVQRVITLPRNNYNITIERLVGKGPLAVRVDASKWKNYKSGIFNECGANGENITINHAAQLVGYGRDNMTNVSYWILRNSWGEEWGEKGFIRLLRETKNQTFYYLNDWDTESGGIASDLHVTDRASGMCGILYDVSYPVVGAPSGEVHRGTYAWAAGVAFGGFCVIMICLAIYTKCCGKKEQNDVFLLDESESLDLNS